MATDTTQTSGQTQNLPARLTTAELIDRFSRYDGPPEQFLCTLLAVQCRMASAEAAAILRLKGADQADLLAAFPPLPDKAPAPDWLTAAAELATSVVQGGRTVVKGINESGALYGQPPKQHAVLIPLRGGAGVPGVAVFIIPTGDPDVLGALAERLELTASMLSIYEMRLVLQRSKSDLTRLRTAMETSSAANEQNRFTGSAMALCNEVASRWGADRVSLGFLHGKYVKLRAMSHTEKFSRKMKVVQDIEGAMEECLDQDLEIVYPPDKESVYIARAAAQLSTHHGPSAVVSLPLRHDSEPVAVLTLERAADKPFTLDQLETLRLACDLVTPRLAGLSQTDRWFGARMAAGSRKLLAGALGAKHTWIKVAAILILGALAFMVFVQGDWQVQATAEIEPTQQRVIQIPYSEELTAVNVLPGQVVEANKTVLATMRTDSLEKNLYDAQQQWARADTDARQKAAEGKEAEAQKARADKERAQAQIDLYKDMIRRAQITSPIDGMVISEDKKKTEHNQVKEGDPLFEVAPVHTLRAVLSIPEGDIAEIKEGLIGEMAAAGYPDQRVKFKVTRINPAAETVNDENVFKVWVEFDSPLPECMRPGVKGTARVDVGRASYGWLWTHKAVNWVRMKLWI